MKTKYFIIALIVMVGFLFTKETYSYRKNVSIGYFYTELSPYGKWIEIDNGVVVWRPANSFSRWAPYSSGTWVWTNYGWYWDSYEPFGHVVYHYGRWYFDDYYGWLWLPDYVWAPAWVEWRYDDFYIGWAPLHPYATYSISFGIRFTKSYYVKYSHWNYVKYAHFFNPNLNNYFIADNVKYRIHSNTKYRSNYEYRNSGVYNRGVDPSVIERKGNVRARESNIVFKERDNNSRDPIVRNNGRIEVSTPREVNKRNENLVFEKRERASSLDVSRIESGRKDNTVTREIERTGVNSRTESKINTRDSERNSRMERSETRINRGADVRTEQRRELESSQSRRETISSEMQRVPEPAVREPIRSVETGRTENRNESTRVQRETESSSSRISTSGSSSVSRERTQSTGREVTTPRRTERTQTEVRNKSGTNSSSESRRPTGNNREKENSERETRSRVR